MSGHGVGEGCCRLTYKIACVWPYSGNGRGPGKEGQNGMESWNGKQLGRPNTSVE